MLTFQGRTFISRVAEVARRLSDDVLIIGRSQLPPDAPPVTSVPDDEAGRGPLAALLTGLRRCRYEVVAVLACDLPCLDASLLRHLISSLRTHEAAVPVVSGQAQSLHAVYRRSVIPKIEALLKAGSSSMNRLLQDLEVLWIEEDNLRAGQFDLRSFTNINDPEDWEALVADESAGIGGRFR